MKAWARRPVSNGQWLATLFVVGMLFAGMAVLYAKVSDVNRGLQANRVTAIEQLCDHDNLNAQHNVDFLRFDVTAAPDLIAKAQRRFKLTPDCKRFAQQTVKAP